MKKRIVIGNWKMYIEKPDEARALVKALRAKMRSLPNVVVALAPPFILIPTVADALKRSTINVGAQSVSRYHASAHTGDVSAKMLKAAGVSFVIVGHSERRALGETNEVVHTQMLEVADAGIPIVLCVGEPERDPSGDHFAFIREQLSTALAGLPARAVSKLTVAYEPVWAIGKHASDAMSAADVQEAMIYIKKVLIELLERAPALRVPIIYGGSVEAENAAALLKEGGVAGFLVGHASSNIDAFISILKACK